MTLQSSEGRPIIEDIKRIYIENRDKLNKCIQRFSSVWKNRDEVRLFSELIFCLFTPQSKAKLCWQTVEELKRSGLLMNGTKKEISEQINCVRFRNNKADYVVRAREFFVDKGNISIYPLLSKFKDNSETRDWLAEHVKGLGYKESSHFLRNIGKGRDIAILDRHILKNLEKSGVIKQLPKTLTPKKYLKIEAKMKKFSQSIDIPMAQLDLVLWCRETGEIFK